MELTTVSVDKNISTPLFMMSKIQKLNGTHNCLIALLAYLAVVYDVKDTKIEWNSQLYQQPFELFFCCL